MLDSQSSQVGGLQVQGETLSQTLRWRVIRKTEEDTTLVSGLYFHMPCYQHMHTQEHIHGVWGMREARDLVNYNIFLLPADCVLFGCDKIEIENSLNPISLPPCRQYRKCACLVFLYGKTNSLRVSGGVQGQIGH